MLPLSPHYKLSMELQKMLNDQMLMEYYSAYLYLSASHHFAVNNMKGFAWFCNEKSKEEYGHGERCRKLFQDLGVSPTFNGIPQVTIDWSKIAFPDILELIANHEKMITESIHKIYKAAESDGNVLVCNRLRWFVDEQLEEETQILEIHDLCQRYSAANDKSRWIDLDNIMLHKMHHKGG